MARKGKKKRAKAREKRQLKKRQERKDNAPFAYLRGRKGKLPPGFNKFTEEDLLFWIAHGSNYLTSNYHKGIWDPLFPDIYDGKLPSADDIARSILERFGKEKMSPTGKVVLSWSVQDPPTVYTFSFPARKAVRKRNRSSDAWAESKAPKNPVVWEMFQGIKDQLLRAQG